MLPNLLVWDEPMNGGHKNMTQKLFKDLPFPKLIRIIETLSRIVTYHVQIPI